MHRGKFWWAVTGSVGLHAALLWIGWQQTSPSKANTAPPLVLRATWVPAPTQIALPAPSPPHEPTPPIESAAPSKPVTAPTPTEPTGVNQAPTDYLPIESVDQPASPNDDWAIDTEVLPRGYSMRILLKLWISSSGQLDHWEFEVEPHNEALARKALQQLDQARIQPARLNNIAVASFRQLEVFISRD